MQASADRPFPWVGLIVLAALIFTSVTSEFLPTGLLPDMARDLRVTESQVGLLITGADQIEHVVDPAQPCGLCHVSKNTNSAISASDDGLLPAIKDTSAELHADPSCWRENLRG